MEQSKIRSRDCRKGWRTPWIHPKDFSFAKRRKRSCLYRMRWASKKCKSRWNENPIRFQMDWRQMGGRKNYGPREWQNLFFYNMANRSKYADRARLSRSILPVSNVEAH